MKNLEGKSFIITGASQGLGKEIAKTFVTEGASVLINSRSSEELEKSKSLLEEFRVDEAQKIISFAGDVSENNICEQMVEKAIDHFGTVTGLINNAGIYGPLGPLETINLEEWKKTMEINLYGSLQMARAIIPHFKANKYGKIIQLSGGGATSPLPRITGYAASKAAIVRVMESLAVEYKKYNIDINSIAPGALNTRLLDQVLEAGSDLVGEKFYERSVNQKSNGGAPISKGAELCVYLASEKSDKVTGRLISALWDNWENFGEYWSEMQDTDIYTLRRIVAKDRDQNWDK